MDITALLSEERADEPRGLWATKQYGDFKVVLCIIALCDFLLNMVYYN